MDRIIKGLLAILLTCVCITGCKKDVSQDVEDFVTQEVQENQEIMNLEVNGQNFEIELEKNDAVQALIEMLEEGPLSIDMEEYGGFEKVGSLGASLPSQDVQTTTQTGDVVLYQSNQIVIFMGSNRWAYTRLGKVKNLTGWIEALGSGPVTITLSL